MAAEEKGAVAKLTAEGEDVRLRRMKMTKNCRREREAASNVGKMKCECRCHCEKEKRLKLFVRLSCEGHG